MQFSTIRGVNAPVFAVPFFREFVVNFDGTGKTVSEINAKLLEQGIFGGKDLKQDYPELGNCALFCITEIHTQDDIDRLVAAVRESVK